MDKGVEKIFPNESNIGGRSIDVGQIGSSLRCAVEKFFPPNEVPEKLLHDAAELRKLLVYAEGQIEDFIEECNKFTEGDLSK